MAPIVEVAGGRRIVANPMSWIIEEEGKVKAEIAQVPLRLAWAITIHKSQGMSLDAVEVDLSRAFEKGMGYVALSRVRTLDGLKLLGINAQALQVHDEVSEFDDTLQARSAKAVKVLQGIDTKDLHKAQQEFLDSVKPEKDPDELKISTYDQTKALVLEKMSLKGIAKARSMTIGTIISHLEKLVEDEKIRAETDLNYLRPEVSRFKKMKTAFDTVFKEKGEYKLSLARSFTGATYNFEELRLARLFLPRND